ncbi:MAG: hypothetical protein ACU83V_05520 [Gammaproteobacteria bacterium]
MALITERFERIRKKSKFIRASARRNDLAGYFVIWVVFKDDRIFQNEYFLPGYAGEDGWFMKKSIEINKGVFTLIALCAGMSGNGNAWGAEVSGTTQNAVGATDFYQVNCADTATDHLSVKVIDRTLGAAASSASVQSQHVKMSLSKDGIPHGAPEISPGEQVDMIVPAGMGPYQFYFEASGPERGPDNKKLKQTIVAEYQCLNDVGDLTKPNAVKTKTKKIKNNKAAKFTVKCGKNKKLAIGQQETTKLVVKLTNTTAPLLAAVDPAQVALNAQIIKGTAATNTTDYNGDDVYSEEAELYAADGVYSVLVNSTANDARDYTLQYSCRDSAGNETDPDPKLTDLFNQIP